MVCIYRAFSGFVDVGHVFLVFILPAAGSAHGYHLVLISSLPLFTLLPATTRSVALFINRRKEEPIRTELGSTVLDGRQSSKSGLVLSANTHTDTHTANAGTSNARVRDHTAGTAAVRTTPGLQTLLPRQRYWCIKKARDRRCPPLKQGHKKKAKIAEDVNLLRARQSSIESTRNQCIWKKKTTAEASL